MTWRLGAAMLGLCLLLGVSASAGETAAVGVNVKDFGAVGDGKADDTKAILRAIAEGKAREVPVLFARGGYRVTAPITLEGRSLVGVEPGGWNADACPMPQIIPAHSAGPVLTLKDHSTMHGLAIVYSDAPKEKSPPAIQLAGTGISLSNVRLQNCGDGIISDGTSNIGRLNIENVFIVAPRGIGVYVTRTYDVPTLRNIEVWNNSQTMFPGPAFKFGHNDGMRASDLFAFNEQVGFEFVDTDTGAFWGVLSNCSTDACSIGVRVDGKKGHTIGITGGWFWDHHMSLDLRNPAAHVRISNAELQSNGAPAIDGIQCKSLLVSNCRFSRAFPTAGITSVNLEGVESVVMNGCLFEAMGPCLRIGPGVQRATITGNIFQPSPYARIRNESKAGKEIVIQSNTGMTPSPAPSADDKRK